MFYKILFKVIFLLKFICLLKKDLKYPKSKISIKIETIINIGNGPICKNRFQYMESI